MPARPRPDIDHHTLKLIVGVIALTLASLTSYFAKQKHSIDSISAAYYETGASHVIFIGFLFAIAAFLLAYNGYTRAQMIASKIAAISTLVVVFVPCECEGLGAKAPAHGIAAAITFGILAFFCYTFYRRALEKPASKQTRSRAVIYAICGVVIVLMIVILGASRLMSDSDKDRFPRLTFYGEKAALIAFGVSWLTASLYLPVITTKHERLTRDSSENP